MQIRDEREPAGVMLERRVVHQAGRCGEIARVGGSGNGEMNSLRVRKKATGPPVVARWLKMWDDVGPVQSL